MTILDETRARSLLAASRAADQLSPVDALAAFCEGRVRLEFEARRLGFASEVRDQLLHEHAQRFAMRCGMVTFWAMRRES